MRKGLALVGAAVALWCWAVPAVASTITWSAPALIDQRLPFAVPEGIGGLACPSIHLCVGTQQSGVEIATNPLAGASAWSITPLPVTPGISPGPIACASPRMCVAVDFRGRLFTSTNPTGGARAWSAANVSSLANVSALSCPRVRYCIALEGGNVVVSTNPTRPSSWRVINVSGDWKLQSVACPSSRLCVGTAWSAGPGGFLTTTSPTGPGWDWKVIPETGWYVNFAASGIACPSTHLCVATDVGGNVFTSTDPAHGRWRSGRLPGIALQNLSCPSVHLCVSVSPDAVAVSTDPAGGARTWRTTVQPTQHQGIGALTCASARLCLATDDDLVLSTPAPARGAAAWSSSYLPQGYNPLTEIACPDDQLCVASDAGGNLVSSGAPAASAAAWSVSPLTIGPQTVSLSTLSCPSASFCAGTTSSGALATSSNPSDPSSWSSFALAWSRTAIGLDDVSCPTATLCAGGDGVGAIHVSSNPSGGVSSWSSQQLGTPLECVRQYCNYDPLGPVSCPSANLCATTDGNYLWVSTSPGDANATWTKSSLPTSATRLFCPSESECLAASGAILEATADPADPSPQWTAMNLPKVVIPASFGPAAAPQISALSCVSAHLCVAVDALGGYAFVGDPGDPNSWTATKLDYSSPAPVTNPASLTGVSCLASGRCVAVDGTGHVIVGTASG